LSGCASLTTIYFGAAITSWGGSMFGKGGSGFISITTDTTKIALYLCEDEYNRSNADTDVVNKKWRGITFGSITRGAPPA
jgi:hypothetical protein